MAIVLATFAAFLLSTLLVAVTLYIATKRLWFDKPYERKIHSGEIPRLGGIGFALAYLFVALFLNFVVFPVNFTHRMLPVLTSLGIIVIFGVVDDFRPLPASMKLFVQSIAALILVSVGFVFHGFSLAAVGLFVRFGWLAYPITFIWIVGVTNAMNLIDGLDGLAGGVSAMSALCYAAIFLQAGRFQAALLCLVLVAVVFGFLVFNAPFPKARIFMGDCGSQFLGFLLAILPLLDVSKGNLVLPIPYAAAVLVIPIFDTFAAIWRRIRDHKPIGSPDRSHLHHKLLNMGLSTRGVLAVILSFQLIIMAIIFASVRTASYTSLVLLLTAYLLALAFFSAIHFLNRKYGKTESVTPQ